MTLEFRMFQLMYDQICPYYVAYAMSRDERRADHNRQYVRAQYRQYASLRRLAQRSKLPMSALMHAFPKIG